MELNTSRELPLVYSSSLPVGSSNPMTNNDLTSALDTKAEQASFTFLIIARSELKAQWQTTT